MLDTNQQALLDQLLKSLTPEQRTWLAGQLSGEGAEPSANAATLQIFFATETGNAKRVAQEVGKLAKAKGFRPQVNPVSKVDLKALGKENTLAVFVSSTHGEGDPPDAAKKFFDTLKAAEGFSLAELQYAVLGLGDRAYEKFCQAAVDIDTNLTRLGAKLYHDTTLLDVDYESHIPGWLEQLFAKLPQQEIRAGAATYSAPAAPSSGKGYNRLSPVRGTIKDIVNLNDNGSNKETYHLEITLDEPVQYAPGDAAGIIMPADTDGCVPVPRLYSIASSQAAHPDELHLTVAHAKHTQEDGTIGFGICSHYLAGLKEGDPIEFYIHRNHQFRLPAADTPIIMVGPGTGIAPFRAFLQERDATGASGQSWLFFGDQHAHTDFLYQLEWQDYLATETLSRIDLAFSRDGKEKCYVQHRMQQKADDLIQWLDDGAYLYVCGAKAPMSEDVEKTLIALLAGKKGWDAAQAETHLEDLREQGRYVKDVY